MTISAKIICDSICYIKYKQSLQRITTFEVECPRYIMAEINKHHGLCIHQTISSDRHVLTNDDMKCLLNCLHSLGSQEYITNRLLEQFDIVKCLITATSFDEFFNLRHQDVQPEIKELAELLYEEYYTNLKVAPMVIKYDEWHLPYIQRVRDDLHGILHYYVNDTEVDRETAIKISCICSNQVSYCISLNVTSIDDVEREFNRLVKSIPINSSVFGQCAKPIDTEISKQGITHFDIKCVPYSGNFANWIQYRYLISE